MKERLIEALMKAASEFINIESNRRSMITVTKVEVDNRGTLVNIFVSVFPESGMQGAVDFLNRNRDEFKQYLKKHVSLKNIPRVRFHPDPVIGGMIEEAPEA